MLLLSCSQKQESENNTNLIEQNNTSWDTLDSEKIDQIKNLLETDNKETTVNTWIEEKTNIKTNTPNKPKINTENKNTIKENTETWVLTEEEIDIIDNTTDAEIDELIDILFKDIN